MRFLIVLFASLAMTVAAGSAYSSGDAARGKKQFSRCKACHAIEAGKNKIGPSLFAIIGRKAGADAKYKYSKSLKEAGEKGLVWGEDSLKKYLKDPTKFLKEYLKAKKVSNKMKNKFKKESLRENIIAYLATLK
ncbi:MAG: c-type cytochrome [Alphaproteobacteria bacterium]|nr:c-type cytochrome [Alphaproteobacteria bacterium]